jgi:hypothetical protein
MRALRLSLVIGLLVASVALGVGPSAASCVGAQISYDVTPVSPGQVVRVTGEHWGTECYDTGNQPRGVGSLGEPQANIEILVLQNGAGPVVARGDADHDYRFVVDVSIPGPLQTGTIAISARVGGAQPQVAAGGTIPVTNTSAAVPTETASFDIPVDSTAATPGGHSSRGWLIAGAVLAAVATVAMLWLWKRSRNSHHQNQ